MKFKISGFCILDIQKIRADFPILSREINDKPIVYLDNAASTQKPLQVTNAIKNYYDDLHSNIHRSIHTLGQLATNEYEQTRNKVAKFINAKSINEIVFTYGTTDSINLVASTFGRAELKEGDEVIISAMEHHANIVPWQMLAQEKNFTLKVAPINSKGEMILDEFEKLLSEKTKLVSIVYVSNSLGTINPIKEIIENSHSYGAKVLIDAAQAIQHFPIDVQELDADFLAFSAHKLYGPTGVGVLYGKEEILESIPPYRGGGEMISKVTFEKTTFNELPYKFEAGTPNIAGVVGFGAAIDYIENIGLNVIQQYESELYTYMKSIFSKIVGIKQWGEAENQTSAFSFTADGVHVTDIATMLDLRGIEMRTGHHCTQPLMQFFGIDGTCRSSISFYNTIEEIDFTAESLTKILSKLRK